MNEDFYHQYLAQYRPFKPYWNYEDGCVLLGCLRMFRATGESGFCGICPGGSVRTGRSRTTPSGATA